jgi:NADH-quinone oxidoreductase subunit J
VSEQPVNVSLSKLLLGLPAGVVLAAAVLATALALWMLLPHGRDGRLRRWLGWTAGIVALGGFTLAGRRLGGLGEEGVFVVVSLVAVVGGAAMVVTRSPVYSAIWFALALAGVAGVLLVLGGQFLGVATIVVYAGAILVMFLFVLMLAQPSGLAPYDRVSNEPFLAAIAGAVLLGLLSLSIGRLSPMMGETEEASAKTTVSAATVPPEDDPLAVDHVARLGGELFGRHLVAVEAAGVLLLVALIGAIAIVSHGEQSPMSQGERVAAGLAAADALGSDEP